MRVFLRCHFLLQGNLPDPGIELTFTHISCLSLHWQADSLPLAPPGKPLSQLPAPKSLLPLAWCCRDFPGVPVLQIPLRLLISGVCWEGLQQPPFWHGSLKPSPLTPTSCPTCSPCSSHIGLVSDTHMCQAPAYHRVFGHGVCPPTKELSLFLLLPLTPTSPFYFRSWATWPGKPYLEYYSAIKRNKTVICSDMCEPRICHTDWSKSEREKWISYINAHIHNLEKGYVCVSNSIVYDSLTPWTIACQALLSMGFPRQEY